MLPCWQALSAVCAGHLTLVCRPQKQLGYWNARRPRFFENLLSRTSQSGPAAEIKEAFFFLVPQNGSLVPCLVRLPHASSVIYTFSCQPPGNLHAHPPEHRSVPFNLVDTHKKKQRLLDT